MLLLEIVANECSNQVMMQFLFNDVMNRVKSQHVQVSFFLLLANLASIPCFQHAIQLILLKCTVLLNNIQKALNRSKYSLKASALLALSKLVRNSGRDIADRVVLDNPEILASLAKCLDEKEFNKKHSKRRRTHLQHDALTCVLQLCLHTGSLACQKLLDSKATSDTFALLVHHDCPCDLVPHTALPAADRLLTLFPKLVDASYAAEPLALAICDCLEHMLHLNAYGYHRFSRRARLLSERHFHNLRFYSFV